MPPRSILNLNPCLALCSTVKFDLISARVCVTAGIKCAGGRQDSSLNLFKFEFKFEWNDAVLTPR